MMFLLLLCLLLAHSSSPSFFFALNTCSLLNKKPKPALFEVEAIQNRIKSGETTITFSGQTIPLDWIAPDLTLAEYTGLRISLKSVHFEVCLFFF